MTSTWHDPGTRTTPPSFLTTLLAVLLLVGALAAAGHVGLERQCASLLASHQTASYDRHGCGR